MSAPSYDKSGWAYALGGFLIWGAQPLAFKPLADVPPDTIIAHRILWTLLAVAILIIATGQWRTLRQTAFHLMRSKRELGLIALSALMVGTNWFLFVYCVVTEQALAASIGYFINPLGSVLLGFLILGERLNRLQTIAVSLAGIGILVQFIMMGTIPLLSLVIAGTFAAYGLFRKLAAMPSLPGLFLEVLFWTPLALLWIGLDLGGRLTLPYEVNGGIGLWLLPFIGMVMTAIPLHCFAEGAKRLPLGFLGLTQYITPSLQFLTALLIFDEALEAGRLAAFTLVWVGLIVFATDLIRQERKHA